MYILTIYKQINIDIYVSIMRVTFSDSSYCLESRFNSFLHRVPHLADEAAMTCSSTIGVFFPIFFLQLSKDIKVLILNNSLIFKNGVTQLNKYRRMT